MTRQVIFLIPLLLVLPKFMQINGIWFAGPIADFLASLVTALFLVHEIRRLNDKHNQQMEKVAIGRVD
jgi:Na+-driven multidrug efflux pump